MIELRELNPYCVEIGLRGFGEEIGLFLVYDSEGYHMIIDDIKTSDYKLVEDGGLIKTPLKVVRKSGILEGIQFHSDSSEGFLELDHSVGPKTIYIGYSSDKGYSYQIHNLRINVVLVFGSHYQQMRVEVLNEGWTAGMVNTTLIG